MAGLKQAIKSENGHDHIIFMINDNIGLTSSDDGHKHAVARTQKEMMDGTGQVQGTGKVVLQVMPAEDGHVHEIGELEIVVDEKQHEGKKKDEEANYAEALELFNAARAYDDDYLTAGEIAEDFYFGDKQWEESVLASLKETDRPALTINKIAPKIDGLSGYARRNMTQLKYSPTEDGDEVVADILNALAINVFAQNKVRFAKAEIFEDMCITGRGNYNVYIDRTKNIDGDIKIERFPWDSIIYGQHEKKDLSDCEYRAAYRWISRGQLKMIAPDKAKEIDDGSIYDEAEMKYNVLAPGENYGELIDRDKGQLRLISVQHKKYEKRKALVNLEENFYLDGQEGRPSIYDLSKKQIAQILSIPGFDKIERMACDIWESKIVGPLLLSCKRTGYSSFTSIPVYATKRKGKIKGKVRDLLDPQREINKRRSTMSDIANKTAATGFYYDDDTFDAIEESKFLNDRSKPGFAIKVQNIDKRPVKEEGIRFPSELTLLEQQSSQDLNEISSINNEMLGMGSDASSSVLYEDRQTAALVGNEYLFDAMALADEMLGKLLIEMFREVYDEARVNRILGSVETGEESQLPKYSPEEIGKIWRDADLSKYDIAVTHGDNSPTKRMGDFKKFTFLAQAGVPVPPQVFVKLSDLPVTEKKEIMQIMQQQAEAEAKAQRDKNQTEIAKTQIAAQSRGQTKQG